MGETRKYKFVPQHSYTTCAHMLRNDLVRVWAPNTHGPAKRCPCAGKCVHRHRMKHHVATDTVCCSQCVQGRPPELAAEAEIQFVDSVQVPK